MDTRTPDDVIDDRLRAAGDRLRATAPAPSATKAALAKMRGNSGTGRRFWWVLPTGLVAAAATTIAVVVLAGGQDEATRQEPAVTPPVPTTPSSPPGRPPLFVGDPPLPTSAAALGCRGTLGDIAAAIGPSHDPVDGLSERRRRGRRLVRSRNQRRSGVPHLPVLAGRRRRRGG